MSQTAWFVAGLVLLVVLLNFAPKLGAAYAVLVVTYLALKAVANTRAAGASGTF